ncbi:MAG: hypothetical protein A3K10_12125 [Bacteroidetes bacterium RIFCSPLOWO2_12_FULL_31_6]|nr:MAG: hypothetical protein A3K10_12125 [Bacteroidetes bacterium RIFCSPLOWO2_12_FULL_31_6]
MDKLVSILFPDKERFEKFFNQTDSKKIYLIPIILGLSSGIIATINKHGQIKDAYILGILFFEIIKMIGITLILSYIYSLVILFLSHLFGGIASIKLTFTVMLYSLFPIAIGSLIILIIKLTIPVFDILPINLISYIVQIWFIYVLLIGISVINNFSYFKSFFSSSIIVLIIHAILLLN